MNKIKLIIFSLIPVTVLLVTLEFAARAFNMAKPTIFTEPLPEELEGFVRPHEELFWSLVPMTKNIYENAVITVNNIGTRGENVNEKQANEYRILSLGESSTLGVGVGDHETYSYLLEQNLNVRDSSTLYKVINGGVSAYSSFQSLKYFELYGLDLQPDLLILYHEVNDYLPSTLRSHGFNELHATLTDMQLYESDFQNFHKDLADKSYFFRFLKYKYLRFRINKLTKKTRMNPYAEIGLPNIEIPSRMIKVIDEKSYEPINDLDETLLGKRVTEEERKLIFKRFLDLCNEHNIKLIVIHPSYQYSAPHKCILTEFCRENNVLMAEAYDLLHMKGKQEDFLFHDNMHPNKLGHRRLANALTQFIEKHKLLSGN